MDVPRKKLRPFFNLIGQASYSMTNQIYRDLFWFDRIQFSSAQFTPASFQPKLAVSCDLWVVMQVKKTENKRKKWKIQENED